MKKLSYLFIFSLITMLSFNSCDSDEEPEMMQEDATTVVDIATGDANFSSLVAALTQVNLVNTLEGTGPFTVFAPTNDAFAEALTALPYDALSEIPNDVLTSILMYHVVSGKVESTDLTTGYITTLNESGPDGNKPSLLVDVSSGVVLNGNTTVTTADIDADNGIVHVDDKVLLPPDVTDIAIDNGSYSLLVDALIQADLVETLQGDGPFTILAPDNAAFGSLLGELGVSGLSAIDNDDLANILLNHVISGNVRAADLNMGYSNTLASGFGDNSASIYVNLENDAVSFNDAATVALADIGATNGTVHAVSDVITVPNVVEFAQADPNFSSLVAALTRTDLTTDYVDILTGDGPFTVFAPTNAAFNALIDSDDDWNELADIPVATLDAVLKYHVLTGSNVQSSGLSDGMMVTTLGGDFTISIDVVNGAQIETSSEQMVGIVATDVQGSNGVIHAIDMVLQP